ncbi:MULTISPECIES: hypothetical protein [Haloferax]|uniref:NrS-1 polymerase-like HBD domain-containing protein n=1 Tax=Haloferax marinum TaxID=2666143 RepID=A0A6A8GAF5_9EURY|nr:MULTISPECIES: hypothetical protein [Haloferax]KAB1198966.1 hypothetical protein Hfx1150_11850 [Haloferax sp. CBA1150]MRW97253.1 hypothetical protein [Haloferax marinum]
MTPPLPTRNTLPDDLCDRAQWVGWRKQTRGGDETKVPLDVNGGYASATDATTWTDFDEALAYARNGPADGVGFVFTEDDPYVGVDLDKCRNSETGGTENWAQMIIDRLDSYTEVSPSGTGYHIIVRGELPPTGNRTGNLELYAHSRFFTVTGDHVDDTPLDVVDRTDELTAIHSAYFETPDNVATNEPPETTTRVTQTPGEDIAPTGNDLTDEDVIERASNAANGLKFSHLWKGDTSAYDSHSEADMALCSMLAFWTGGDAAQMDRVFRNSGLYRDKWDDVHFSDGSTYGEKTIERAITGTTEYYDPSQWSSAVRRSTTRQNESRRGEGDNTSANVRTGANRPERDHTVAPVESPAQNTEHLERLKDLQTHLESVIAENERLQGELEDERERRRELEAQLADRDEEDGSGWSLFGWFRS